MDQGHRDPFEGATFCSWLREPKIVSNTLQKISLAGVVFYGPPGGELPASSKRCTFSLSQEQGADRFTKQIEALLPAADSLIMCPLDFDACYQL
jgi:hypothetical protein